MRFYGYTGCETCRKAKKWLTEHGIEFKERPIRDLPPTRAELARMLDHLDGEVKRLFNTSSRDYRALGGKDRVAEMSTDEVFDALTANGNLIKRPFVLTDDAGVVGFKPDEWTAKLAPR